MEKDKFQSMEKRQERFRSESVVCANCKKKYAVIRYKGLCLCADCLNPDIGVAHQQQTRHFWCGLKNSWGDF
jgi:uncharacterized CHY-type Zn-finger protein